MVLGYPRVCSVVFVPCCGTVRLAYIISRGLMFSPSFPRHVSVLYVHMSHNASAMYIHAIVLALKAVIVSSLSDRQRGEGD